MKIKVTKHPFEKFSVLLSHKTEERGLTVTEMSEVATWLSKYTTDWKCSHGCVWFNNEKDFMWFLLKWQ